MQEQSQVLTFDGKKIIPNTAKIDLLGCEDKETFKMNKNIRDDMAYIEAIENVIDKLKTMNVQNQEDIPAEFRPELIEICNSVFKYIGSRLQILCGNKSK